MGSPLKAFWWALDEADEQRTLPLSPPKGGSKTHTDRFTYQTSTKICDNFSTVRDFRIRIHVFEFGGLSPISFSEIVRHIADYEILFVTKFAIYCIITGSDPPQNATFNESQIFVIAAFGILTTSIHRPIAIHAHCSATLAVSHICRLTVEKRMHH